MFYLITGGSGSGKSEYAENQMIAIRDTSKPLYYIATMEPFGEETYKKIERHRLLRAGKGFETLECYTNLKSFAGNFDFGQGSVLLECMSNLAANEVYHNFRKYSSEQALIEELLKGIIALKEQAEHLIVVTNEVCSECTEDTSEMQYYKRVLSGINLKMANISDEIIEVVYGIPVKIKEQRL